METLIHKAASNNPKCDIVKPNAQHSQDLHIRVKNPVDYCLSQNQSYVFNQAQITQATHLGFLLNYGLSLPRHILKQSETLERVHENIAHYGFNTE
jgi:hypothetical protein